MFDGLLAFDADKKAFINGSEKDKSEVLEWFQQEVKENLVILEDFYSLL